MCGVARRGRAVVSGLQDAAFLPGRNQAGRGPWVGVRRRVRRHPPGRAGVPAGIRKAPVLPPGHFTKLDDGNRRAVVVRLDRSRPLPARHDPRRTLSYRRPAGAWRDGRGLPRGRPQAGSGSRAQVPAAGRGSRSGTPDAAAHRSAHGSSGLAPQRVPRLRHRRRRGAYVPVDGVRGRRGSRVAAPPHRPLPAGARARNRAADLRRPQRGARARRGSPRLQTGERDDRRYRQSAGDRLRARRDVGRVGARRYAGLHGTRADRRR